MRTQHDPTATVSRPGGNVIDPGRSTVTFRSRHLFGLALAAARGLAGRHLNLDIEVVTHA